MTTAVLLRSRMMGNYQVRFWRATALVRESLTLIISAALNIKQRGLQVFPVPKKASKREGIKITRDLDTSIVTTMINVFKTINQAHNYSRQT